MAPSRLPARQKALQAAAPAAAPQTGIATTLGALVNAVEALNRLIALRLPVAAAYHVAKLAKLVDVEVSLYEQQRRALVTDLGVTRAPTAEEAARHGAGEITVVPDEQRPAFNARIAELTALPVTLAWKPLTVAELGAVDITAGDLLSLGALIDLDAV